MDLKKLIENAYFTAGEWYHCLHKNPELSEQETNTADLICGVLDDLKIEYRRNIAGHGILAIIRGEASCANGNETEKPSPCVAIRADIDALPVEEHSGLPFCSKNPGVMHACGHDLHTAILLGAAMVLQQIRKQFMGSIKLIFQPAEETIGGAERMLKEGIFSNPNVTSVIGLHMDPTCETGVLSLREGPMNAAVDDLSVTVIGKQCHGAHPEQGVDPIVIAADIILALQTIVSRATAPTTPAVVTIGQIRGGTGSNTIPEKVFLEGTLRSLTKEGLSELKARASKIAELTAAKYGGTVEISGMDTPFPPLCNDATVCAVLEQTAKDCQNIRGIYHMPEPSMGADDFAFFSEEAKGAYFNLGCTKKGETGYPLHSDRFSADEAVILSGIELEVKAALALLENDLK